MQFLSSYSTAIIMSMFLLFAVAEILIPMNKLRAGLSFRWFTNLMMTACVLLIYKILGPAFAVVSAVLAERFEVGLFNQVESNLWLVLLFGILIFDFKQYWFHRLVHYFDALWLVHRVHHSDIEIDLTTGFRFHPIEAVLNLLIDLVLIGVFGIAAEVLLVRYLLIFLSNFFTHANICIPPGLDRALQWVFVTPSMHHLHHAMDKRAANSNFGVLLSFWDRIFGTYSNELPRAEAGGVQTANVYGLREFREPERLNLWRLMVMPFMSTQKKPAGDLSDG
jgi:sterol desaturase/sphingolipid hydroxylase (fatty acid hydroxylase superfamily)